MSNDTRTPAVVDRYVRFWNAATADERARLAAETFADDVGYRVPLGIMHGAEQLIGFRDDFARRFPDYVFRDRAEPDAHHDRIRVPWELSTGGETFATGTDVLELGPDGRIAAITGFLDRAPAGFRPHDDPDQAAA